MNQQEAKNTATLEAALMAYGHLPKTRAGAIETGAITFFSGEACVNGHYSPRYTKSQGCVVCQKEVMRDRRAAQREAQQKDPLREQKLQQRELDRQQQKHRQERLKTLSRIQVSIESADGQIDKLVASYLIHAGGRVVVPGVIADAKPLLEESDWLVPVIQANRSIYFNAEAGVVFMPSITAENRPSNEKNATYWRKCLESMDDCIFTHSIRCLITTMLTDAAEQSPRGRNVLKAWLGVSSVMDTHPESEAA